MLISNYKQLIKKALKEDIGKEDITSNLIIDAKVNANFSIIAKEKGVICGIPLILEVFKTISKKINITVYFKDGDLIKPKDIILIGEGRAKDILLAERVALNFLQYLSAISTKTRLFVEKLKNTEIKILDTRKTLPLYRKLAKYAVKKGGGENHRFCLDDLILIKDNHIIASENIKTCLEKCKVYKIKNPNIKIEIECETLEQIEEVLQTEIDIIMLDNMDLSTIKKAIKLIAERTKIEVSGNITLDKIDKLSKLNIDYISVGTITNNVQSLDLALNLQIK